MLSTARSIPRRYSPARHALAAAAGPAGRQQLYHPTSSLVTRIGGFTPSSGRQLPMHPRIAR